MIEYTFTDIPGEIRNQIYSLLLIIPRVSTPRRLGDPPIYPQILSTCHKIHEEARQILLRLYYDTISSASLISLIRRYHIRVRLDCDPNFSVRKATDAFSGVDELTLEVFQAQFGSSDHKVLRLFEGIRAVKKTRIYGSTTMFPEYAEWLEESMRTPVGEEVLPFDKDRIVEKQVRSYDIWTVSGSEATKPHRQVHGDNYHGTVYWTILLQAWVNMIVRFDEPPPPPPPPPGFVRPVQLDTSTAYTPGLRTHLSMDQQPTEGATPALQPNAPEEQSLNMETLSAAVKLLPLTPLRDEDRVANKLVGRSSAEVK
ncbi:uncharacterized protein PAC_15022 [Phialocephala subalpina]|uniref:Uncharacterized protein n=1 Tax=Phialocephala subalpina TaxID=576137 RepID=A0A1L7XJ93_9HELO|nr:uncharacterized protein PAC_15022 [Phialocephala subalpina]